MRKLLTLFTALLMVMTLSLGNVWAAPTAATLTAGKNGSSATVNSKAAIKVGTSKKSGDMTITVGAGATTLNLHAVAWSNAAGSIDLSAPSGVTLSQTSLSLSANSNISGTSTDYEIETESDYLFTITLTGVESETEITLTGGTTSGKAKRFVVWGATYEIPDPKYAVTITAPEHGTITVTDSKSATVISGAEIAKDAVLNVSAAPKNANEYLIKNLRAYKTGDTNTPVAISNGQLTMPAYPITITADESQLYGVSVTVDHEDKGSATINGGTSTVYVEYADDVALVATPKVGYEFVNWTASSEDIEIDDDDAEETTATIGAAGTIIAHFKVSVTPSVAVPASVDFGTVRQHAKGSDETEHMIEAIEVTGANLTDDVKLEVSTVGGGAIFALTGYHDYVVLTPENGTINTTVYAIAATGFSDKATYEGKITVTSLAETPEFEQKEIDLSITITPTYLLGVAVNNEDMGSATINGGTNAIYAANADELALVAIPKTGYEFVNWTLSAENIDIADVTAATTTADNTTGAATITANFQAQPTVNWYVNGELAATQTSNTGSALTETPDMSGTTLAGKTFVGWITTEIVGETDTKPTFIPQTTMPAGGATYYAVFAVDNSVAEQILLSEEFDNTQTGDANQAITSETFDNFSGQTTKAYKGHGGIKFGSSSAKGYITSKELDLSKDFVVTLKAMKYGSDAANIEVTAGETTIAISSEDLTSDYQLFTLEFDGDEDASAIKIGTEGGNRAYIDSVVIKYRAIEDISAYATNAYAVTFSAPKNGTLVVKNGGVAIESGDEFVKGTVLTVVATPASGYQLATLTAGVEDISSTKSFTIGTADVEVVATFSQTTALDNTELDSKAVKLLRNGVFYIEKNGKTYNAQGQLVK